MALAVGAGMAAAALVPAAASADSIAYVKDHNVWIAEPDGTKQHQVTADGSQQAPYRHPSQADDGTIVVGQGHDVVALRQNGEVVRRVNPPALSDSAGQAVDGTVDQVAVSPNGQTIAYTHYRYTCPPAANCAYRGTLGFLRADGSAIPADGIYGWQPSFASNGRILAFGGAGSQVGIHDVGSGQPTKHWFDDDGYPVPTDLSDGDLTRSGNKLALVRGYSDSARLVWYSVNGDALNGAPPARPDSVCQTGADSKIHSPSWAPDGDGLAVADSEGIVVLRNTTTDPSECGNVTADVVLPGAEQPDWGPAAVNPQPRTQPGGDNGGSNGGNNGGSGGGNNGGSTGGNNGGSNGGNNGGSNGGNNGGSTGGDAGNGGPVSTAALRVKSGQKLRKALSKGLSVQLAGLPAGKVKVQAKVGKKVVATGTAKVAADGTGKVTLKFTKAAKKSLAKKKSVKLALVATGAPKASVTLRR